MSTSRKGLEMAKTVEHRLIGQTVTLASADPDMNGKEYRVEDYWENVSGGSWKEAVGNPAALLYAIRVAKVGLPADDDVVYGKIGAFGHLVHGTELPPE